MVKIGKGEIPVEVAPGKIIDAIRNGRYRSKVQPVRNLYQETLRETGGDRKAAKDAVGGLKKKLPGIMWSGTFSERGDESLKVYSHLLCADLDHLDESQIMAALTKAQSDPHVFTSFRSPTDTGVKVVFRVGGDAAQHHENFLAVKEHVRNHYGLEVDEACKNVERLCFVSDSPGASYNNQSVALEPIIEAKVEPPAQKSIASVEKPTERRNIAERILGTIKWVSDTEGYCKCPGEHLHTTGNAAKDCVVYLNGSPTIKCFHGSCSGIVAGTNYELRSRIGKAEMTPIGVTPTNAVATVGDDDPTEFDFANRLAESLPSIRTCGKAWFAYQAGAWREIDRATLRPQAQNILPPVIRTARREAALLDHLEGRFQVSKESFAGFYKLADDGGVLLNAANGVVRVKVSGEITLEPHGPDHLFTHRLAASYRPEAKADLFHTIIAQALPDEMDRVLYQLCAGNFLLPDSRFETALICYGEAGRGKSTAAEPIAEAIGRSLVPRLTMAQICDPKSYHVPKLRFAAVNLGTELDAIELGDSGPFKAIVSGEPIEARPIYGEPFTMGTPCKLWFLSNCLPRFKHGTEAELRRTRFLRFDYNPPKKDVTLKSRLALERDGVFLWMLAGLGELLHLPFIPLGGAHSKAVHERFKVGNDPVGSFVSSCCHLDPEGRVSKTTIGDAYREYCERNELAPNIGVWFFRSLYDRWPQIGEVRARENGGQRTQMLCGIQLKAS